MRTISTLATALALTAAGVPAAAQTQQPTEQPRIQDRIGQILGQIFGGRGGAAGTLDAEWAAGRFPLAAQRAEFESRVDGEVRARTISFANGNRLKRDYYDLTELEARYGADRRFTTQERADLRARYDALTRALSDGSYGGGQYPGNPYPGGQYPGTGDVRIAEGQADFERRVSDAVGRRQITRSEGSRLRSDYAALVRLEEQYLRDGYLTDRERTELETRLDALEQRVGDAGYGGGSNWQVSPRERLDGIARALPSSGLSATARAQLLVEHGDLVRLDAAYARLQPSAEERAYLDRRISDLEMRARVRR